jgi:NADPH:quinone reductase-like Zn-dependent oxidoreductase
MLVYRGQWPQGVTVDATIDTLAGSFAYPLAYGYCAVGRVIATGAAVSSDWLNRRVFAFQPHQNLFCAGPETLHPIPDDLDDETALFLPSMETAVNLLLDGGPLIGEKVIVVGQGIIGLLTTALLFRWPHSQPLTTTPYDGKPLFASAPVSALIRRNRPFSAGWAGFRAKAARRTWSTSSQAIRQG